MNFGKSVGWIGIVLVFGALMGIGWDYYRVLTEGLPYEHPLRIMAIGLVSAGLAFAVNHSKSVQQVIPEHYQFVAVMLFGAAAMLMGWACTYSAFPAREPLTDVGIRVALSGVAFLAGLVGFFEVRRSIRKI